jgi:restriction system protein
MPRRFKYTLGKLNRQNLSPVSAIIVIGLAAGGIIFVGGSILIIAFTSILFSVFQFSNEFTFFVISFAALTLIAVTVAVIIGIFALFIYKYGKYKKSLEQKYRAMQIANIDGMSGIEFEQYLQRLLTYRGFSVNLTRATGDLGIDLIASGNGIKIAIQAKRYHSKVSRRAISDAVAGMSYYGCNKSMVITNNYFSSGAITLAKSTGCILINRDTLATWINEYQGSTVQSQSSTTNHQLSIP